MKYCNLQLEIFDRPSEAEPPVCRVIVLYDTIKHEVHTTGGPLYPREVKLIDDAVHLVKDALRQSH